MITEQEKQEIIDKAVEKALLLMPDVVGNLMMHQAVVNKLNSQFYADNKEFADQKKLVASVIEEVEGKNPTLKYEEILERSVPEIKRRISQVKGLEINKVQTTINREFKDFTTSGNGAI